MTKTIPALSALLLLAGCAPDLLGSGGHAVFACSASDQGGNGTPRIVNVDRDASGGLRLDLGDGQPQSLSPVASGPGRLYANALWAWRIEGPGRSVLTNVSGVETETCTSITRGDTVAVSGGPGRLPG